MNTKITAKDFFLHIAVIALLYMGTVALLNILFRVINVAFPQVTQYGYFGSTSISLPVATIIVVFFFVFFFYYKKKKIRTVFFLKIFFGTGSRWLYFWFLHGRFEG